MSRTKSARGFTLVELIVVIGLITTLVSLILPVTTRLRKAARATACTSNLRQLGIAMTMYVSENKGKMIPYVFFSPTTPDASWDTYWPGVVAIKGGVKDRAIICPEASDLSTAKTRGYGNAFTSWSGQFAPNASAIRYNQQLYRDGSYGYNRYLTAHGGFDIGSQYTSMSSLPDPGSVPMFFDCGYVDALPSNGTPAHPPASPRDLKGTGIAPGCPEHWKILIARHSRGINVCMADASVRWVPLEELYTLQWQENWYGYRLILPAS